MGRLPIDQVRELARGRWLDIVGRLCPALDMSVRHDRHRPCPVHGGTNGFKFFKDAATTGGGVCNSCGPFSDGFALIGWMNGWDFRQTVLAVMSDLGMDEKTTAHVHRHPRKTPRPSPATERKHLNEPAVQARRALLNRLWSEAIPFQTLSPDSLAARYIAGRGIDWETARGQKALRFHPGLIYAGVEGEPEQQVLPAIIARFVLADGRPVTFHRTFLDPEGRGRNGKADVAEPKRMMRCVDRPNGGAIRLKGRVDADIVNVCEGLETGLSVCEGTHLDTYCCTTAVLMEGFDPPPGKRVLIWADADLPKSLRPGQPPVDVGGRAAEKLLNRLKARGVTAAVRRPFIPAATSSVDWNDVHVAFGVDGILAALYGRPTPPGHVVA